VTAEQDAARARVRLLAEKRVEEARIRVDFAVRNGGFSDATVAEYRHALELAEAALWPWQEMDRMMVVFKKYYQAMYEDDEGGEK
jgi:hypothetical protein